MSEILEDSNGAATSALSRRRLLKGAAAVGAGAVAWSAPNITTLGFRPAYASVCSIVALRSTGKGGRNTACNCELPCNGNTPNPDPTKYISYKELQTNCGVMGDANVLTDGPMGASVGDSGRCPPGTKEQGGCNKPLGTAHATIPPNNDGLSCIIKVVVQVGNACNAPPVAVAYSTSIGPGGGSVPMPLVECQGGGNLFTKVFVLCSKNSFCLTECSADPDCAACLADPNCTVS